MRLQTRPPTLLPLSRSEYRILTIYLRLVWHSGTRAMCTIVPQMEGATNWQQIWWNLFENSKSHRNGNKFLSCEAHPFSKKEAPQPGGFVLFWWKFAPYEKFKNKVSLFRTLFDCEPLSNQIHSSRCFKHRTRGSIITHYRSWNFLWLRRMSIYHVC